MGKDKPTSEELRRAAEQRRLSNDRSLPMRQRVRHHLSALKVERRADIEDLEDD